MGKSYLKFCVFLMSLVMVVSGSVSAQKMGAQNEYYSNGKLRVSRQYNDEDGLASVKYYREDGSLEISEKYDMNGHKIEEVNYGENGRLRENSDGWAAIRWKYRGANMVEEDYYGGDGRLKERKQYNELGDLINKQYVGDPDLPAEEYNPIPPLAGESVEYYDENGKEEGKTSVEYDDGWF